jgi:hypothetical protein
MANYLENVEALKRGGIKNGPNGGEAQRESHAMWLCPSCAEEWTMTSTGLLLNISATTQGTGDNNAALKHAHAEIARLTERVRVLNERVKNARDLLGGE